MLILKPECELIVRALNHYIDSFGDVDTSDSIDSIILRNKLEAKLRLWHGKQA